MQNSQGSIDLSFSRIERKRERERPSQRASKSHPRQCRVLTRVATWYELERGSEWIDKQLLSHNDRGLHFTRYRLSATGIGPRPIKCKRWRRWIWRNRRVTSSRRNIRFHVRLPTSNWFIAAGKRVNGEAG